MRCLSVEADTGPTSSHLDVLSAVDVPKSETVSRFAVIELAGSQYKVAQGDLISAEKLDLGVSEAIALERVLMVGTKQGTVIGSPLITGATVEAVVEEQALADKVIVFKKRRRKGYRRWKGHRQPLTILRIGDITLPPELEEQLLTPL